MNKTQKQQPVVTLTLTHGVLSPAQRVAGRKLWAKLIASVKADER